MLADRLLAANSRYGRGVSVMAAMGDAKRHVVAAVAIALLAAGVVIALVPVSNDIQQCGNPVMFLVDGRVNAVPGEGDPEVTSCSELSGQRVAASAVLVVLAALALLWWAAVADRADRHAWEAQQRQNAPTGGA